MANFIPLKNYMFYCLDRFVSDYKLSPPFLDIGCGVGDLSSRMAERGWKGEAIDPSEVAIKKAEDRLKLFPEIKVSKKSLFEEDGLFNTIFIWDVLEHIKDDNSAFKKLESLLQPKGHILISVPYNPTEWRWDDDFYGHYRRYTIEEMREKLIQAKLEPIIFWDFTYPFFWIMRRIYLFFKSPCISKENLDMDVRTSSSSIINSWDIPIISGLLNKDNFLWRMLYKFQFALFKNKLGRGGEMFILARKPISKLNG